MHKYQSKEVVNVPSVSTHNLRTISAQNLQRIRASERAIQSLQAQMKAMSGTLNTMIEQKLRTPAPKGQDMWESRLPSALRQQISRLREQRQEVYGQIDSLKSKTRGMRENQEAEVVQEIRLKEAMLEGSHKALAALNKQRQILEDSLLYNKQQLKMLKDSPCITQITEQQQQLAMVVREAKGMEKEIQQMEQSEVLMQLYMGYVQAQLGEIERKGGDGRQVREESLTILDQIKYYYQEKRNRERQYLKVRQSLCLEIQSIQGKNAQLLKLIKSHEQHGQSKKNSQKPIHKIKGSADKMAVESHNADTKLGPSRSLPNLIKAHSDAHNPQNNRVLLGPKGKQPARARQMHRSPDRWKSQYKPIIDHRLSGSVGKLPY